MSNSASITTATSGVPALVNSLAPGSFVSWFQSTPASLSFVINGPWAGSAALYISPDNYNLFPVDPSAIRNLSGAQAPIGSGSNGVFNTLPLQGTLYLVFGTLTSGSPTAQIQGSISIAGQATVPGALSLSTPTNADLGSLYATARVSTDVYSKLPNGYGPDISGTTRQQPLIQNPTGGVIYGSTTGNDSTGNGTIGTPYLTITKCLSAGLTAFPQGNFKVLLAAGTYGASGNPEAGNRWILNCVAANWVSVETQSGNQDVIVVDNESAASGTGAVQFRGSSVSNLQIKNILFKSSGIANNNLCFSFNPSGAVTCTNLQFVNCIFQCIWNSSTNFYGVQLGPTDTGFTGLSLIDCTWTSTGSGTTPPQIMNASTTTLTTANQPFVNFGMYGCATDPNSTFFDFGSKMFALLNPTFLSNAFITQSHGFVLGSDTTGPQSANPVPQCTGVYVAYNYFQGTTGVGHGCLIGNAVNSGVVEYNRCIGTEQGLVIKSASNVYARRNWTYVTGAAAICGLQVKASTNTSLFACDTCVQSTAGSIFGFEEEYDSGVTSIPASNTTLQGCWITADGANAVAVAWQPPPQSLGGAKSDFQVYRLANGATSGIIRNNTISPSGTVAGLTATWALDTVAGDVLTNDANSQFDTAGSREDVSITGTASSTYYAEYVYSDGRRFTGINIEPYNPQTQQRYAYYLFPTAVGGTTYTRPNPENLVPGSYSVIVRQQLGLLASPSDPIQSTSALNYAS